MNANILQINFKLNVSPEAYTTIATGLGDAFASVDGLEWKIWLLNPEGSEAGGIYCFRDTSAAQAFLGGRLVAQVKAAPFLTDLSVKQFQVMDKLTAVTRGPVTSTVAA
ncbi:MAG: YdhR family protein [Vicinamibacterales bacterium]